MIVLWYLFGLLGGVAVHAVVAHMIRGYYVVYDNRYDEAVKATYTYKGAERWARHKFALQSHWYVRYES